MKSRRLIETIALVGAVSLTVVVGQPALAADEISDGQWYHQFLDTTKAHGITQGEGITVAIIDTGVDASHPDLAGSVLPGTDLTAAGPGDGRADIHGHGTGMASLIAGHGRVKGIAPAAKILPVRAGVILEARSDKITEGITWAVDQGAKVISISLGSAVDDPEQHDAVKAALAADVVVVAAIGNMPEVSSPAYPAAYPGVVAVSAIGRSGEHADNSMIGSQIVIAAPGDVSTAYRNGRYNVAQGTSNATAITAGAVALIRARYPQLKAPEVVRRLTATATDKGAPGRDQEYGFGVLNLVAALTADLPADPGSTPSTPDRPIFPLWILLIAGGLLAIAAVTAVVIIAVVISSRSRSRRQSGPV
ncbi:MAG TPA: S8 family serine peptidase [Candidatus Limnocylindrales bacterium]